MKALVYDGVKTLTYRDVEKPVPAPGDHLIRIKAVGICGSDMHAYLGHDDRRPAPLILGHEAAGVIEGGPRHGERVTINPLRSCGRCHACTTGRENLCPTRQIISMPPREGAFADYVTMREANLVTVPEGVSFEKACLAEPLAVSWHAARLALEKADPTLTEDALVIGGGAIGLAAALALETMGVTNITIAEPTEARAKYLETQCNHRVVGKADGQFGLVFDAVGYADTRAIASAAAKPGGLILHIGLGEDTGGLDVRRMTLQEIGFIGTYSYTAQDFRDTAAALFDGRLGPLTWPEARALKDGASAFKDLYEHRVASPKIVLIPDA